MTTEQNDEVRFTLTLRGMIALWARGRDLSATKADVNVLAEAVQLWRVRSTAELHSHLVLMQDALQSIEFDCSIAKRDGGYDGVVPAIHETALRFVGTEGE